jgi:hypothetical protein
MQFDGGVTKIENIPAKSTSEDLHFHKGKVESGTIQLFEEGTLMKKMFENPSTGELQFYEGKVASFDPLEGYYLIVYSDGDMEELTEKELMMHLCV